MNWELDYKSATTETKQHHLTEAICGVLNAPNNKASIFELVHIAKATMEGLDGLFTSEVNDAIDLAFAKVKQ